jgi:drug/metabolite transporter (DMT)-like permease
MPLSSHNLIGLVAIVLWSQLAVLTALSGAVPPFQLAAMTFLIGGGMGALSWLWRPYGMKALRQIWPVWRNWPIWLIGVVGLFGNHAFYFAAIKWAPPAEAGLINYLWPLLIVLFSGFLPGESLKMRQVIGAVIGFSGVVVLALTRADITLNHAHMIGYLCALAAGVTWAAYSVLSRRFAEVPTDAVTGFCLVTCLLSAICHVLFETTIWPETRTQWLAILALGAGPVGIAFYLWDHAVKKGNLKMLGLLSYATPLLSTSTLVVAGFAEPSFGLALACLLIVAGALYGSR